MKKIAMLAVLLAVSFVMKAQDYKPLEKVEVPDFPSNEVILSALKEEKKDDGTAAFPPEICSRFATGNIIMFNHLPMHHLAAIVQKKFDSCVRMIKDEYDIEMELDDKLPFVFLYHQLNLLLLLLLMLLPMVKLE